MSRNPDTTVTGDAGIGPHEGKELDLLLAGQKPLAMFSYVDGLEDPPFPEDQFTPHVVAGRLLTRVCSESIPAPPPSRGFVNIRRVLYATPDQEWRLDAMILVCEIASQLGHWDEGLERVIGRLLGYTRREIDDFIRRVMTR